MNIICPHCGQPYELSDESPRESTYYCTRCEKKFSLSQTTENEIAKPEFIVPVLVHILKFLGFGSIIIPVFIVIYTVANRDDKLFSFVLPILAGSIFWFVLAAIILFLAKIEYNTRK